MKNREAFVKFMAVIGEMFEKNISSTLQNLYWTSLGPYTDEQCIEAFNVVIKTSRFFPKPIDLLEAINGPQENNAVEAWLEVLGAVRNVGPWESVKFDDPVIHSVIEAMGGWVALGDMLVEEEKWKQKEFEKLYAVLRNRGGHKEYLPGIHEIHNSACGFTRYISPPLRIGTARTGITHDEKEEKIVKYLGNN